MKITKAEYEAIRNNGADIDISKISSCSSPSIEACEQTCRNYYCSCQTIAMANDILAAYENGELEVEE